MADSSNNKQDPPLTEEEFLDLWFDWGTEIEFKEKYTPNEMVAYKSEGKFIPLSAFNEGYELKITKLEENEGSDDAYIVPINGKKAFYYKSKKINFYKGLSVIKLKTSIEKKLLIIPDVILEKYNRFSNGEFNLKLDTTNKPIYRANTYKSSDLWEDFIGLDFGPITNKEAFQEKIANYIKFFFYNVAGKHGNFWIVNNEELAGRSDVNHILNFGNETFYDYQIDSEKWTLNIDEVREQDSQPRKDEKDKSNKYKKDILNSLTSATQPIKMEVPETIDDKTDFIVIKNVHMLFKNSLFTATVNLVLKEYKDENDEWRSKGDLSLSNEKLIAEINK